MSLVHIYISILYNISLVSVVNDCASHVLLVGKNMPADAEDIETLVASLSQEEPWRRAWQPIPIFLPRESHGQRSLEDHSPQGGTESDMTEAT